MADIKATPTLIVPLTNAEWCGQRNPRTNRPCRRAEKHTGRHAFIWQFVQPGKVREVWDADCQVCGKPADGAVCRECGA